MLNILIVKDNRQGEQPLLRTMALAEILGDKKVVGKEIKVEIVENVRGIKERVQKEPVHAVIFLTRTMAATVERLALEYSPTRFFIFTGRIPEERVIWIEREWLGPDFLKNLTSTINEY